MLSRWTRRQALEVLAGGLGAAAVAGLAGPGAALARVIDAAEGEERVFGLRAEDVQEVLLMATKAHDLPQTYVPRDLVGAWSVGVPANGVQYVRRLIVDDTRAMVRVAAAEGHHLSILSAYRSYAQQQAIFAAQVARRGGDEQGANRFSARPGQSQHQLGTTMDFQSERAFRAFAGSPEGQWLWERAHEFGFVFPYTEVSQERTGYISEPWHVRWVGRGLSEWMHSLGYQTSAELAADDLIAMVRRAAGLEG